MEKRRIKTKANKIIVKENKMEGRVNKNVKDRKKGRRKKIHD